MGAVTLASSPQSLDIAVGAVSVALSAVTLASSPQNFTLIALGADLTLSMGVATLVSSAQSVQVITDQTVSMGAITLASSPQSLEVIEGATIVEMSAVTLASSAASTRCHSGGSGCFTKRSYPRQFSKSRTDYCMAVSRFKCQSLHWRLLRRYWKSSKARRLYRSVLSLWHPAHRQLTAIGGATSVALSAVTLASSPQNFTLLALGADQTITMGYATLASTAQALSLLVDQIISMGSTTLASSPQSIERGCRWHHNPSWRSLASFKRTGIEHCCRWHDCSAFRSDSRIERTRIDSDRWSDLSFAWVCDAGIFGASHHCRCRSSERHAHYERSHLGVISSSTEPWSWWCHCSYGCGNAGFLSAGFAPCDCSDSCHAIRDALLVATGF